MKVNEKDYYVIRKQSEVFSGVEFVLDFNQVESLVSIKGGGRVARDIVNIRLIGCLWIWSLSVLGKDDKKKKSLRASQKFMSLDERSQIHVKVQITKWAPGFAAYSRIVRRMKGSKCGKVNGQSWKGSKSWALGWRGCDHRRRGYRKFRGQVDD